jgi:uncharacterized cupredoxin-like copper-binding protein
MKTLHTLLLAALAAAAGPAVAHGDQHAKKPAAAVKEQKDWGIAGDAKDVKRTIEVKMLDAMRFAPDRIEVKQGETIRFVHRNVGKQMHEFVIGTKAENDAHAELMKKHPGMEHGEPYMAHVPGGKTGQIIWTFNRPGEFEFACLIPGHYQAGMVGKIKVAAAGANDGRK